MNREENYIIVGESIPLIGAPYFLVEVEPLFFGLARRISPTSDGAGFLDLDNDICLVLNEDIVEDKDLSKPRALRVERYNYGLEVLGQLREVTKDMGFPYVCCKGDSGGDFSVFSADSLGSLEIRIIPRFFYPKYDLGIDYDFLHPFDG